MKKRILFVDDEPLVLQGVQRMMRKFRGDWDTDFADGGANATECIGRSDYDIVITDMMMPGMDGAQLLEHVRQHSPRTIRIVLSGHAEQSLTLKCVGLAHQYLSKPCDAAMLKRTVARVSEAGFGIRNEKVMRLVAGLESLPSIPTMYAEIVRMVGSQDSSIEDVGELISRDMAMTAKVLQIVNSSFFGLAHHVSTPAEAVAYLGLDTLKALVLATNVFGQFAAPFACGYSAEEAVAHSQRVGACARAIARAEQAPRAVVEDATVAGLLHDVGKLVLATNLPAEYQRVLSMPDTKPLAAEQEVLGATHAEVGGYLLGLWGLPEPVVEAIALHHHPGASPASEFSPLTAVHVANSLVNGAAPDAEYLARIGCTARLPDWQAAVEEALTP